MFVRKSKKVFTDVHLQRFDVGWVKLVSPCCCCCWLVGYSWLGIAHNIASFCKLCILMTCLISAF